MWPANSFTATHPSDLLPSRVLFKTTRLSLLPSLRTDSGVGKLISRTQVTLRAGRQVSSSREACARLATEIRDCLREVCMRRLPISIAPIYTPARQLEQHPPSPNRTHLNPQKRSAPSTSSPQLSRPSFASPSSPTFRSPTAAGSFLPDSPPCTLARRTSGYTPRCVCWSRICCDEAFRRT